MLSYCFYSPVISLPVLLSTFSSWPIGSHSDLVLVTHTSPEHVTRYHSSCTAALFCSDPTVSSRRPAIIKEFDFVFVNNCIKGPKTLITRLHWQGHSQNHITNGRKILTLEIRFLSTNFYCTCMFRICRTSIQPLRSKMFKKQTNIRT